MTDPGSAELGASAARLDPWATRRHVAATFGRVLVITVLLLVVYFNLPLGDTNRLGIGVFVVALIAFALAIAHQIRRIIDDPFPRLRAAETLATAIPVFIVMFAIVYAALAQADPANFNQPLDRLSTLYFTVTVLSTVGFGDIAARTDTTRAIVMVQMILDLVLIGVVVKVVIGASRIGTERRDAEHRHEPGSPDASAEAGAE